MFLLKWPLQNIVDLCSVVGPGNLAVLNEPQASKEIDVIKKNYGLVCFWY